MSKGSFLFLSCKGNICDKFSHNYIQTNLLGNVLLSLNVFFNENPYALHDFCCCNIHQQQNTNSSISNKPPTAVAAAAAAAAE